MGAFALLLRWLAPWQAVFMAAAALILNSFFIHRITRGALLRPSERESSFSRGVMLYPATLLLTFIVFGSRLELAAGVWALLAVGDGMAALSGLALRGPRLPWNPKKTWSGLVAFVVFGTASSAWIIRWTQQAGSWTLAGSLMPGGLMTLGGADPSARIGTSFLLGTPLGQAGASSVPGSLSFLVIGCLVAATAAALVESLDSKIDDNILVTVVGGAVLWGATLVDPERVVAGGWLTGMAITVPIAALAYFARAVDRPGALVGVLLAIVLYVYAGWPGLVMLGGMMVIGTVVTRLGYARKKALGVAEGGEGRRAIGSVVTNAGAGVVFSFLAVATPYSAPFTVAMVAAFATSLFDTTATEVGQAFGRRNVLIATWRPVPEGTVGGVSLVGTAAGLCGATVLAGAAWTLGLVTGAGVLAVAIGAFSGSTIESFLGALMGRGSRSDHHLRNLVSTVAGAGVAYGVWALLA
jgi:uncharacterized protein (TIGR00297 family)